MSAWRRAAGALLGRALEGVEEAGELLSEVALELSSAVGAQGAGDLAKEASQVADHAVGVHEAGVGGLGGLDAVEVGVEGGGVEQGHAERFQVGKA